MCDNCGVDRARWTAVLDITPEGGVKLAHSPDMSRGVAAALLAEMAADACATYKPTEAEVRHAGVIAKAYRRSRE